MGQLSMQGWSGMYHWPPKSCSAALPGTLGVMGGAMMMG